MFGKSKLGSICYYVSDIKKTETFYRDVLGLEMQSMGDDGSGNDWLMGKTANDIELLFFKHDAQCGDSPIIVFDVPDGGIDDIVTELTDKGVTIVTPVSHAPGGWSCEISDPDGHTLSMYQAEDKPRSLK